MHVSRDSRKVRNILIEKRMVQVVVAVINRDFRHVTREDCKEQLKFDSDRLAVSLLKR